MKKIVSVIRPFTLEQNIFVYEDGNKIDVASIELEKIQDKLIELAATYEVKEIQLIGSKNFCIGIKQKIETAEIAKYGKNELEIKIVNN